MNYYPSLIFSLRLKVCLHGQTLASIIKNIRGAQKLTGDNQKVV
jgi:hypothetical protein